MQHGATWLFLTAALCPVALVACNSASNPPAAKVADSHDHDHGHDHEHAHHGPHQGHLMVIGNEEYHAEWTHDESGKVTFYILDAAAKKDVPIAAEQITIDVKIGDNPPKTYELVAVNPMDGKTAAFEIVDKQFAALFDQLKSSGLKLTLHVNINGKQYDQLVKEHDHHH
jgi:hypothetical protein